MKFKIPLLVAGFATFYACKKEAAPAARLQSPVSLSSLKNQEFVDLLDKERTIEGCSAMILERFKGLRSLDAPKFGITEKLANGKDSSGKTMMQTMNLYEETQVPTNPPVVLSGLPIGHPLPNEHPSVTSNYQWRVCNHILGFWKVDADGSATVANGSDTTSYFQILALMPQGSRISGLTLNVSWAQSFEGSGISAHRLHGWHEIRGTLTNGIITITPSNVQIIRVPYKNS